MKSKSGFTLIELLIVIVIIGLLGSMIGGIGGIGCSGNSSEGERTGQINKLAYKGVFGKSWEGEMLMGGIKQSTDGGVAANVWLFTVTGDENVKKADYAMKNGIRVTCKYTQPLFYNTFHNRSGGYYVHDISVATATTAKVEADANPFK